jgi:hypothetical protein
MLPTVLAARKGSPPVRVLEHTLEQAPAASQALAAQPAHDSKDSQQGQ